MALREAGIGSKRPSATSGQIAKLSRFADRPDASDLLGLVGWAMFDVAGLDTAQLGNTWGVTVARDDRTVLRVNGGVHLVLDVMEDDDLAVRAYVAWEPPVAQRLEELGIRHFEGFTKRMDLPNRRLEVDDLAEAQALLTDPVIGAAFRRFVEKAASRTLPNQKHHNPLVIPPVPFARADDEHGR